jgi:hypothetical protein
VWVISFSIVFSAVDRMSFRLIFRIINHERIAGLETIAVQLLDTTLPSTVFYRLLLN